MLGNIPRTASVMARSSLQPQMPRMHPIILLLSCILFIFSILVRDCCALQIPSPLATNQVHYRYGYEPTLTNLRRRRKSNYYYDATMKELQLFHLSHIHNKNNNNKVTLGIVLEAKRIPRTSIGVDTLDSTTTISRMMSDIDKNTTTTTTTTVVPSRQRISATERIRRTNTTTTTTTTTSSSSSSSNRMAPHQYDHRMESARPFIQNVKQELQKYSTTILQQSSFDLQSALRNSKISTSSYSGSILPHNTQYQYYSLNELFPTLNNISELFYTSTSFRDDLRNAIRHDIFYSTTQYQNMSLKAQQILLLPDSSIQGTWKCVDHSTHTTSTLRMIRLTATLQEYFGPDTNITGDAFMETIGALCRQSCTYGSHDPHHHHHHWMDIVGIKHRRVTHSWHQDTGRSHWDDDDDQQQHTERPKKRTVLWGFPCEDEYNGIGVFSHIIPLQHEQIAMETHPIHVPIVYDDDIFTSNGAEDFIIRPTFRLGQEILVYSDTDVLHSAPDMTYRMSCMRFM